MWPHIKKLLEGRNLSQCSPRGGDENLLSAQKGVKFFLSQPMTRYLFAQIRFVNFDLYLPKYHMAGIGG